MRHVIFNGTVLAASFCWTYAGILETAVRLQGSTSGKKVLAAGVLSGRNFQERNSQGWCLKAFFLYVRGGYIICDFPCEFMETGELSWVSLRIQENTLVFHNTG